MKFYSTRHASSDVDFKTALFQGIAPDDGLYMPREIPWFSGEELMGVKTLSDAAFLVMRKWIDTTDISDKDLREIVKESFTFPMPLIAVGDYRILELFHGPTMAFKDIAARVLAQLFAYYLKKDKKEITILVATSGDTGGAIAQAFSGVKQVKVVVLYPEGKVSMLQEEQLTRVNKNVVSIAVGGDFDDCQSFVKRAFQDPDLQKFSLSSANSINIGRLIPQIIYYVWAYCQAKEKDLQVVVPSGNMGNATAAVLAKKMGLPLEKIIIATNENDAAVEYYKTGVYQPKKTKHTLSTAMDIGSPNNFERLLELFKHDHQQFCNVITVVKVSDAETVATIKNVYKKNKYLFDFHTSVGCFAAQKDTHSNRPVVVISTASPMKFAKEMKKEIGIAVDNSGILKKLRMRKKNVLHSVNDYQVIKRILLEKL